MTSPGAISAGDDEAGLRVEYVRRRGVLRLSAWRGKDRRVESMEVPVRALFDQLGIEPDDLAAPRQWLLFAGRDDRPQSGAALVGAFGGDDEARQAFRELSRAAPRGVAWAELVVLDQAGRARPVCWFGRRARSPALGTSGSDPPGAPHRDAAGPPADRGRRRLWPARGLRRGPPPS